MGINDESPPLRANSKGAEILAASDIIRKTNTAVTKRLAELEKRIDQLEQRITALSMATGRIMIKDAKF